MKSKSEIETILRSTQEAEISIGEAIDSIKELFITYISAEKHPSDFLNIPYDTASANARATAIGMSEGYYQAIEEVKEIITNL